MEPLDVVSGLVKAAVFGMIIASWGAITATIHGPGRWQGDHQRCCFLVHSYFIFRLFPDGDLLRNRWLNLNPKSA